ncbi:terminase large subunit [Herbaspirillum huttiense]|uniref:terminase large subunit n=1 Tax=Herbaspirillum huttiense TaxID=863372 RepID=UPI001066C916|nr:terminase large subunit [Herbaspirillum huttiense]QBP75396.1 terminase large subunit [Herbaspirillum huttiense]
MPAWSTACPDWGAKLKGGASIIPPPIFPEEAERALAIFKQLKIVDAPGSPTFGEAAAQWVFDLVASVFGAYDPESGRRLITEWFVCIPKKNSKSSLAAGIMMTALILNWRLSAEYTILAPTIEVANNSFAPSRDMVKHEEELDDLFQVQTHIKTITHRTTDATLKVVAADANTVGGKKSVGTLIDELHLFGEQADAEQMFREAIGGLASRPEGFVIYLTTQSAEPPAGVFREKLQYARDVRDGKIHDPRFQPVIFEHPPEMVASKAHLLKENLALVNPNLGYSVDEEFLYREYDKSKASSEESFRGFLAKHGNVEIGLALRSDRWSGADQWERQATRPGLTLKHLLEECEVIDVGADGGGNDDWLGLAAAGRHKVTREWLLWTHAWVNPPALELRKSEVPAWRDYAKLGELTICASVGPDVIEMAEMVASIEQAGLLDKVGVDPGGMGGILDALIEAGVPQDKIVGISQGWKLGGAIKTTERKLAEGVLVHGGQKMMNYCVSNAKVEPKGNAILITKQASGTAKIDPLMATFNAISLLSLNPAPAINTIYERRGIRFA